MRLARRQQRVRQVSTGRASFAAGRDRARAGASSRAFRAIVAHAGVLSGALLLVGCALVPASLRTSPGGDVAAQDIELRGNEALSTDELELYLRSLGAAQLGFDPAADAAAILAEAYRRRGFFSATIERIDAQGPADADGDDASAGERELPSDRTDLASTDTSAGGGQARQRVVLQIDEGPVSRVTARTLQLVGHGAGADGALDSGDFASSLLAGLPCAEGDAFEIAAYEQAKQELMRRLHDQGYLAAVLAGGADVDPTSASVRIAWRLEPGPVVLRGRTQIEGLVNVTPQTIEREIGAPTGTPISDAWLAETQRRLASLGWFRSVTVRAAPPEPGSATIRAASGGDDVGAAPIDTAVWPIAIRVEERPARSVEAAVGYGTEDRIRVRAGWEHRHLLGTGRALRLSARYSSLRSGVEAGIIWPHIQETDWRSELSVRAFRETLGAFDASRFEARAELVRELSATTRLRLGHRYEISRTSDVSPLAGAVLDDPEERIAQSSVFTRVEYNALDDLIEPARGQSLRLSTDLASVALGSDDSYVRSEMELRMFRPWASTVLAGRLRLGTTVPFGASQEDEIPLTERFFAGGGDSVRGFEYQQLGPLDASDEPLGGTSVFVANLELRAPIYSRLGGVVFLDAGQVDLEPLRLRVSDIRYAAGVGLRLSTPIGPLRLDVAHLLNRPRDLDPVRIHLSVGHSF